MSITCWVDTVSGRFLERSPIAGEVGARVTLDRNPDLSRERYTGNPVDPIRPATAQELTDTAMAQTDTVAQSFADRISTELKAVLIVALWQSLGHQPTAPELAIAMARLKTVYKVLT